MVNATTKNLHTSSSARHHTTLNAPIADATLQQAVREKVLVQLVADDVPQAEPWRGSFLKLSTKSIEIAPLDAQAKFPQSWMKAALRAVFCVDGRPYAFISRLAHTSGQAADAVVLERPESLAHVERRLTPRRRFQPGVPVQILATPNSADVRAAKPVDARLLNLSESGMACLIDADTTPGLFDRASVQLMFELSGAREPFALNAVVITTTHGVGHHRVVGLEFVADEAFHAQSVRLRQCLQVISNERKRSEPARARKESVSS